MGRTITSGEIGGRDAADLLREVAHAHEPLRVVLEDGDVVTLDPCAPAPEAGEAVPPLTLKPLPQFDVVIPEGWKEAIYETGEAVPELKPLTVLPGHVPDGWKDAIYDFSESEL